MYIIEVAGLTYKYILGTFTIGIVTPSRKKHLILLGNVQDKLVRLPGDHKNGSADDRLSPEEVAAYVLKHRLK